MNNNMERVIIGADDIYKVVLAQICSGMIAAGRTDDNEILDEAKCWARIIMGEDYYNHSASKRKDTGFVDAKGNKIYDGDIFIYDQWQFNKKGVPEDLISKFEKKYADKVCLHPVFWDEDEGMWASDVYGDCDRMGKYDFSRLIVVSNNIDHPELYNH